MRKASFAPNPEHQFDIGVLGEREVLGFDKGAVHADIPQPAFSQLDAVMSEHLDVGHPTRVQTTLGWQRFIGHVVPLRT